jgi:hypothetical protein
VGSLTRALTREGSEYLWLLVQARQVSAVEMVHCPKKMQVGPGHGMNRRKRIPKHSKNRAGVQTLTALIGSNGLNSFTGLLVPDAS